MAIVILLKLVKSGFANKMKIIRFYSITLYFMSINNNINDQVDRECCVNSQLLINVLMNTIQDKVNY